MASTPSPPRLAAQVQRLGCSSLLCLLIISSLFLTGSSLGVGLTEASAPTQSLGTEHQEELCTVSTLPAIKFVAVAGMGFVAGGVLTIQAPLASALLHGL